MFSHKVLQRSQVDHMLFSEAYRYSLNERV
jgi:hypothetical protein